MHYHFFIADIAGIIGVIIVIVTYLLLQLNKLAARSMTYSLLNILGSFLIIFSLLTSWNPSAFLIEVAWLLISAYGVYESIKIKIRQLS